MEAPSVHDHRTTRAVRPRGALCAAFVALFLCSAPTRAHAGVDQWTSNGPYGGAVWALAINPVTATTLYAGTPGGIFRTTDGGASWSAANNGVVLGTVLRSIVIDPTTPSTIYFGAIGYEGGVFKSTDGGASWNAASNGLPAHVGVWPLAIDPVHATTLYAGPAGGGLYKSTDGAVTWSKVTGHIGPFSYDVDVIAVAIDPANPSTVYAGAGQLYKSTDSGATWIDVTGGISSCPGYGPWIVALAIDPANPSTLYALDGYCGPYKSTDGGGSWTAINTGLPNAVVKQIPAAALAIDPVTTTTLYVGLGREGVFRSADGGATWSAVASDLPGSNVFTLAIDPTAPSTLYVATDGGVSKRTSELSSLTAASTGLTNNILWTVAIDPATPTTIYAVTNGGGVFRSTDGGASWSATNAGITHPYIRDLAIDPTTPTTLYAGSTGGVFRSTDGAESWTAIGTGLPADVGWVSLAIDPVTPTTLYAGVAESGAGGVYKSTDGAATWTFASDGLLPLSSDFYNYVQIHKVAVDPTNPSTLYAGTASWGRACVGGPNWGTGCRTDTQCPGSSCGIVNSGVYKSTDGAASWTLMANGWTSGLGVFAIAIDPTDSNTLYAGSSMLNVQTSPWGVFRSTDGGASWNATSASSLCYDHIYDLAVDPITPTTLYAAGSDCGVLQSTDGGTTWSVFNAGLATGPTSQAAALAIDPTTPTRVYVGTEGGGFVSPSVAAELGVFSMEWSGNPLPTPTPTPAPTSTPSATRTPSPRPTCASSPRDCRLPAESGKAKVALRNKADDKGDAVQWMWSHGLATQKAEFGDPVTTDAYTLCLYDGTSLLAGMTVDAGGSCAGKPCWRSRTNGFLYKNKAATPDGLSSISLGAGVDGKAKIQVKGKGANLHMPDISMLVSPVTAQLVKSSGGTCFGAVYSFPPVGKNDGVQFKDRAD